MPTASRTDVNCDYCGNPATLLTGAEVYPHRADLAAKAFWTCGPCGAYVGVHDGSTRPLGRLANRELRAAKVAAHSAFDPIWKGGLWNRGAAYAWLARELKIDPRACHLGMFDVGQCHRVIDAVKARATQLVDAGSSRSDGVK